VREADRGDALGVDLGQRLEIRRRGEDVRRAHAPRQRRAPAAETPEAASAKAVEYEGGVPLVLEPHGPFLDVRADASAAVEQDDGREGARAARR